MAFPYSRAYPAILAASMVLAACNTPKTGSPSGAADNG